MPVQNMTQLSANARYFMKTVPEVCVFNLDDVITVRVFPAAPANTTAAVIALTTSSNSCKSEVVTVVAATNSVV